MKILLTLNKTLRNRDATWIDGGYWNFYLPLQKLGHEVYLYDTVEPEEKDYSKIVESFKPDLKIFPRMFAIISLLVLLRR